MVGNGHQQPRQVVTAAGAVEVTRPRVDDRRPDETFTSAVLPPYMRRSAKVTEALLLLYLRGLSSGDFAPTLVEFFGTDAGLSSSTMAWLTESWRAEHEAVDAATGRRRLRVLWADGVHVNVRLPDPMTAPETRCACWCWSAYAATGPRS